jgi:hypothetical protein
VPHFTAAEVNKAVAMDWKELPEDERRSYPVLGKRKASEALGPTTRILKSVPDRARKRKLELYDNMTKMVHLSL